MTADEAKQALEEGKKVRTMKWCNQEYICKQDVIKFFHHGEFYSREDESIFEEYKDDEWEIVE